MSNTNTIFTEEHNIQTPCKLFVVGDTGAAHTAVGTPRGKERRCATRGRPYCTGEPHRLRHGLLRLR